MIQTARQRPGVLQSSGAFERRIACEKRRRTGALQDAAAICGKAQAARMAATLGIRHSYALMRA
ncbi:MAG: hypothetical protein B7Z37_15695 [Verrucomicrobia bacterium 12-59-8]|nr:MAG: hypothetical protein B7Z37_15695 [Verrucomicrobia bacterium 12-59-8]